MENNKYKQYIFFMKNVKKCEKNTCPWRINFKNNVVMIFL